MKLLATASFLLAITLVQNASALPEDRNKPISIDADHSRLNGDKTTVFTGNVIVIQGTTQINADKLTAYVENNRTTKLIAEGKPVLFKEQPQKDEPFTVGSANRLELDVVTQNIALIGSAYLNQDGKEMRAEHIMHDSEARLTTAGGEQERVKVILQPKNKDDQ